ncbi:MAG: hypothetical protein GC206_06610 [Alphaproteobacteria bacterium]|nr:hypothetical protein [Alphaproteobacteria bacterium]
MRIMDGSATLERDVLSLLRDHYEARGFQFIEHPPRQLVPAFLGDYLPDALALGETEKVVIEVKSRRSARTGESLQDIASRFTGQGPWIFRPVFTDEFAADSLDAADVDPERLHAFLQSTGALIDSGHEDAALLMAWAALEAVARASGPANGSKRPMTPTQLIESLVADGRIDQDEGKRLREISSQRNSLAHGDIAHAREPGAASFVYCLATGLFKTAVKA